MSNLKIIIYLLKNELELNLGSCKYKTLEFNCIQKEERLQLYNIYNFQVCAAISIPKTCYSNEITLKHECSSSDLAESLKFKVQDRTGIPVESITFLCWDNVIPDNVSLYDIGPWPELSITALIDAKE